MLDSGLNTGPEQPAHVVCASRYERRYDNIVIDSEVCLRNFLGFVQPARSVRATPPPC